MELVSERAKVVKAAWRIGTFVECLVKLTEVALGHILVEFGVMRRREVKELGVYERVELFTR